MDFLHLPFRRECCVFGVVEQQTGQCGGLDLVSLDLVSLAPV